MRNERLISPTSIQVSELNQQMGTEGRSQTRCDSAQKEQKRSEELWLSKLSFFQKQEKSSFPAELRTFNDPHLHMLVSEGGSIIHST